MKIEPTYLSENSVANLDAINANSILIASDGSGLITNTRLPGFKQSSDPTVTGILPCPSDWGTGVQVSILINIYLQYVLT